MTAVATLDELRTQLHARIRAAHAARVEQNRKGTACAHQWQRFKQTVTPDNDAFKGTAYFVVNGCLNCKRKELLDYVVQA
jgi:hypothetical protein